MIARYTLFFALFLAAGCATVPSSDSDQVREGMDKAQVLEAAGNPKRTVRANGQDHWIYVFFVNGEEHSRQITFEDGKVVKVGRALGKHNWVKELEK